ncbi:dUTP diphosphatase [Hominenteromicrobium sp.]|uniref:dUTP diphosphatase n=1 Tax=Hominenteromicrobium sp. TaxID=3073581 RepID=UPI003AB4C3BE
MEQNMVLKLMCVREGAIIPKQATAGSAGYDLCACMDAPQTIEPGERCVFPSGLAAEIPAGTAGFVFTRSGLGIKKGIHVTNGVGVIDSDYRGEIRIGLHNLSAEPYTVQPGERIAQMIIMPYFAPVIEEVTSLTETDRGAGGFGSTGTK